MHHFLASCTLQAPARLHLTMISLHLTSIGRKLRVPLRTLRSREQPLREVCDTLAIWGQTRLDVNGQRPRLGERCSGPQREGHYNGGAERLH